MIARILVMPAASGPGAPEMRLAQEAVRLLGEHDAAATLVSLEDYALPVAPVDADAPVPQNARLLAQRLAANDALLVVTGERHALPPLVLLNALDWIGRVRDIAERPLRPFAGLIAGLAGIGEAGQGGTALACAGLRTSLSARGVDVVAPECRIDSAAEAFDGEVGLKRPGDEACLTALVERLLEHAWSLSRHE